MSYHFIFPVGDHSHDGHDFCADFLVKSDLPLNDIRKTQFHFNHFIGSICSKYEINYVSFQTLINGCLEKTNSTKQEVIDFLFTFLVNYKIKDERSYPSKPLTFTDFFKKENLTHHSINELDNLFADEDLDLSIYVENAEEMIQLWTQLLNWFNPLLNLEVVSHALSGYEIKYKGYPVKPDGDIDIYSQKEREELHLNLPGYGVWNDSSSDEFCAHSN